MITRGNGKTTHDATCELCHGPFRAASHCVKYCSPDCQARAADLRRIRGHKKPSNEVTPYDRASGFPDYSPSSGHLDLSAYRADEVPDELTADGYRGSNTAGSYDERPDFLDDPDSYKA